MTAITPNARQRAAEACRQALWSPHICDQIAEGKHDNYVIVQALAHIEKLETENSNAWRERNEAYAKVKAWESVVYVESLPMRAVPIDEWGESEGETTSVPQITTLKLTELLDEIAALRASQ